VIARDGGSSNVWVKIRGLDDRVRVLGGGGGHLGVGGEGGGSGVLWKIIAVW